MPKNLDITIFVNLLVNISIIFNYEKCMKYLLIFLSSMHISVLPMKYTVEQKRENFH